MDWRTCIEQREVKGISPDSEMATALQKTAANKRFSAGQLELREETATAKISLSYDAVRELLEALALAEGFKIYNHVCYAAFLAEILHRRPLSEEFDQLRKVRNDINYYGKELALEEARELLKRLEQLYREARTLVSEVQQS